MWTVGKLGGFGNEAKDEADRLYGDPDNPWAATVALIILAVLAGIVYVVLSLLGVIPA